MGILGQEFKLNSQLTTRCMDIKNVRQWCREFNEGRINVHDEQQSGRPRLPESTVARIDEMMRANRRISLEKIEDGLNIDCSHFSMHKIVSETLGYRKVSARWADKWLKEAAGEWYNTGITKAHLIGADPRDQTGVTRRNLEAWNFKIEETLGIPKTTADRIMREHLGLRKLSARWVPKLLTPDQKAVRRKVSSDNLALFEANPEEFVNRFVTIDETWAHHFTPESKQQSMQWRHSGSPPPKKAKTVPSAGKIMAMIIMTQLLCIPGVEPLLRSINWVS
ncbi:hypothetical protein LAZ67_5003089 [Cordylochernes scorpioides]|uniref:Transposase n=1 Tax=Cordylochernes scorpioides TaxID=51811 RepID=A0ABY6KK23_9ARAC|nr:hypothetical protein LAZ67_5003089 [Cordylochernes scorpioides]